MPGKGARPAKPPRALLCNRVLLAEQVVEVARSQSADHGPDRVGRVDQRRALGVARVAHRDRSGVKAGELDAGPLRVTALTLTPHRALQPRGGDPAVDVLHCLSSPDALTRTMSSCCC